MRQHYSSFSLILLLLSAFLIIPLNTSAQLSGSYTINASAAASNTNYRTWASAISDLSSGSRSDGGTAQGPGVSAAVTFTVYDSSYNIQISIPAINGASGTNKITFKSAGGDSTACKLTYASASAAGPDYVVQLNGCDNIVFQEIGFERTGTNTYCTVVEITGDADSNKFYRCQMKGRKMPSNSSLGFQYGVGSCVYFTGNGDYNEFIENKMIYGYNGVYGTVSCSNNQYIRNYFDTSGSAGIYLTSQSSGLQIIGNTFNMGDFGPNQGHYTSYGLRIESSPAMIIAKNKVFMLTKNAQVCRAMIIASTTSSSSSPTLIANNWIMNDGGTGDCTGFALYNCNYLDFYYNNVLITNSLASGAAYYHYANYTNSNINLVNNNLINKGGGFVYNVPGTNTGDLDKVNYNNVYTNGSYLGKWSGTDYNTFSSWKSASGKDSASVNIDPGYTSNKNLHVSNVGINGKALVYAGVTDDIDGDARSGSVPDIGADEFFPAANDAGVSNIDSPLVFCAGVNNIRVTLQNYGTDTLKSVEVNWQLNGTSQTAYSWTGSVAPGGSSSSITLGSSTFSSNTAYTFKVWTKNPNSLTDGNKLNDTLTITRYPGMTGSYSIGDTTGTNYKSFNDAITDMTARGVCGAVTFNVYAGIYNEQITLVQLPGMNSSRPVTFRNVSSDSTTVTVTLPTTSATGNNNAALQLRGADYVTFKGITFERTGLNTYGFVIHILNGSNYNSFENCRMLGIPVTSNNANAYNIYSDQGIDNGNVFQNNYIRHGTFNMYFQGLSTGHETGTRLEGNVFDSAYRTAIAIGYNDDVKVRRNYFRNTVVVDTGTFDLRLFECDSTLNIAGNYFTNTSAKTAISLEYCDAYLSGNALIANNFIAKTYGVGINLDAVTDQVLVYNSLNFTNNSGNVSAISATSTGSSGIILKNNNVVVQSGTVVNIPNSSFISASDYNNFYARGSQFAVWGNTYSSLAALQGGTGKDSNSVSLDPLYKSSSDLHMKNPLMKGAGAPVSWVTTDIDGETRSSTIPDIGADEFELSAKDAGITAILTPGSPSCTGIATVTAIIRNYGKDTLTSATIEWAVNSVAQTSTTWSGSLLTNETDTVVVGDYSFSVGNPAIMVRTTLPNGAADEISFNDSFRVTRQFFNSPTANAGADKTACLGDSVSIGTAALTGYTYSWTDMSNNNVGNSAQIYVKPAVQSSYVLLMVNNSSGCSDKDTVLVNVSAKPTVNAGVDQAVCNSAQVQIGESFQSGHTYSWTSVPSGFTSVMSNPIFNVTSTRSYIVTKTNTASGCAAKDTVVVTALANPVINLTGGNNACQFSSRTYSTTGASGNTYTWSVTGGSIVSGQNTNSIIINWGSTSTGTLQLIEMNSNSCSDTAAMQVNLQTSPVAKFTYTTGCAGSAMNFRDSSTGNIATRSWNFGDGGTATTANPTHTYTSAGSYQAFLYVTNTGGCGDTDRVTVIVTAPPVADFETGNLRCAGTPVSFIDSSSGATSWSWNFGNGNTSTTQNPTVTYAGAGLFSVKLVAGNGTCKDSITKQVTIFALPDAGFSITANQDTVSLTPDLPGAAGYLWDFGDGQTSTVQNPVHVYNVNNQWMRITLTVTEANGCSNTSVDSVFITKTGFDDLAGAGSIRIYPNPFTEKTVIALTLINDAMLEIDLFDASGRKLSNLYSAETASGNLEVTVDGNASGLAPGVYVVVIRLNGESTTRRLIRVE